MFYPKYNEMEKINLKTASDANFYQRQPKISSEGCLHCVDTNSLDIHVFSPENFCWTIIPRKTIGW